MDTRGLREEPEVGTSMMGSGLNPYMDFPPADTLGYGGPERQQLSLMELEGPVPCLLGLAPPTNYGPSPVPAGSLF